MSETHGSALAELQDWYAAQCDGDWEHHHGISIGNIDNPGWCLCIDLEGTGLADAPFPEYRENYDDELDWLICTKYEGQFSGNGGPRQLERLLRIFLEWARSVQSPGLGQPAV